MEEGVQEESVPAETSEEEVLQEELEVCVNMQEEESAPKEMGVFSFAEENTQEKLEACVCVLEEQPSPAELDEITFFPNFTKIQASNTTSTSICILAYTRAHTLRNQPIMKYWFINQ